MASDAQRDVMKYKHEKDMKDRDIEQKERESKRKMATDIITSVTGNLVPNISLGLPKDAVMEQKAVRYKSAGGSYKDPYRFIANAADWYARWIELKLVASIPEFNDITTYKGILSRGSIATGNNVVSSNGLPLILSVKYSPVLGHSYHDRKNILNATTAGFFTGCNQALSKMLSQIGKANSRSVSGSTEAIGYYITLTTDLAALLARLNTHLAMVESFNPEMTRIREAYFESIHEDTGNVIGKKFVNNRAQWRKLYAELAARFNAEVVLPKDLTLLKRRVWLNSTLLKDANLSKGQIWCFAQAFYRGIDIANNKLVRFTDPCLGTLLSKEFDNNWLFDDIANFRLYFEHVLFEISKSSTYKELVSNMRACIPPQELATMPEEPANEPYVMGISDEVLSQIHNMDIPIGFLGLGNYTKQIPSDLGAVLTDGDQIYENSVFTVFNNIASNSVEEYTAKMFGQQSPFYATQDISLYKSGANADDIAVATRLKPNWFLTVVSIPGGTTAVQLNIDACGSEIPLYLIGCYMDANGILTHEYYTKYNAVYTNSMSAATLVAGKMADMSKFDWCVPAIMYETFSLTGVPKFYTVNDIGNVFPFAREDAERLQEACVKSEYYVDPNVFKKSF